VTPTGTIAPPQPPTPDAIGRWTPVRRGVALLALLVLAYSGRGCGEVPERRALRLATTKQGLDAVCTAQVVGVGARDTETDYLPHVVACENGAADFEALKAQAVAARSVLYYKMATAGSIRDGQSDQVYTCNRPPDQRHFDAVAETAGEVMTYRDTIVFAFYVAGAIPTTGNCIPAAGDRDPTNTERYVTYNQGRSGDNVEQTNLGWVNAGNHANRGCQSQNGANCLSRAGRGYRDILQFYYGNDFSIVVAEGGCVEPQECEPAVRSGGETIIDDRDSCFTRGGCNTWNEEGRGHAGHLWWTHAWDGAPDCQARWRLRFEEGGEYDVDVWVEDFGQRSTQVPYTVRYGGQQREVVVSQAQGAGWVSLGRFGFAAGDDQWVSVHDGTGEPFADRRQIVFDALRLRPAQVDPPGCQADVECADRDVCNGAERCVDGDCQPGQQLVCQDDEPCTRDLCDPAMGCVFEELASGTECGQTACGPLVCRNGECQTAASACDDDRPCTFDNCDPGFGCTNDPLPDGSECGPGRVCQAGACVVPGGDLGPEPDPPELDAGYETPDMQTWNPEPDAGREPGSGPDAGGGEPPLVGGHAMQTDKLEGGCACSQGGPGSWRALAWLRIVGGLLTRLR